MLPVVDLRMWWRRLLDPQLPGMADHAPRAKLWVMLLGAAGIAGLTLLRYNGLWKHESFAGLYMLLGSLWVAAAITLGHGTAWLRQMSRQSWLVLAVGFAALLGFWHLGRMDAWGRWWAPHLPADWPMQNVIPFAYFSASGLLFRLAVPALAAQRLGISAANLGWKIRPPADPQASATTASVWPIYLALYLIVLPTVWIAAGTEGFQAKYPMARLLIGGDKGLDLYEFLLYQLAYALVFVSGECFWRGWLTFGVVRDLGSYAIIFMLVPYVVAHFGKPLPETLGAIAAGSALGWLALQHRSVWLGVALHYGVALTMDLSALYKGGLWFRQFDRWLG